MKRDNEVVVSPNNDANIREGIPIFETALAFSLIHLLVFTVHSGMNLLKQGTIVLFPLCVGGSIWVSL